MHVSLALLVLMLVAHYGFARDCTTYSCLRSLYNSRVTSAVYYTRPMTSFGSECRTKRSGLNGGLISDYASCTVCHAGVVVTTASGERWLIHKGKKYGSSESSTDTVITDANYMSSRWTRDQSADVDRDRTVTVGQVLAHGNANTGYSLFWDNCQHAADGMWRFITESPRRGWFW